MGLIDTAGSLSGYLPLPADSPAPPPAQPSSPWRPQAARPYGPPASAPPPPATILHNGSAYMPPPGSQPQQPIAVPPEVAACWPPAIPAADLPAAAGRGVLLPTGSTVFGTLGGALAAYCDYKQSHWEARTMRREARADARMLRHQLHRGRAVLW